MLRVVCLNCFAADTGGRLHCRDQTRCSYFVVVVLMHFLNCWICFGCVVWGFIAQLQPACRVSTSFRNLSTLLWLLVCLPICCVLCSLAVLILLVLRVLFPMSSWSTNTCSDSSSLRVCVITVICRVCLACCFVAATGVLCSPPRTISLFSVTR